MKGYMYDDHDYNYILSAAASGVQIVSKWFTLLSYTMKILILYDIYLQYM